MAKAAVIINEQHKLFPEQERLLNGRFPEGFAFIKVPAEGWTKDEIIWKSYEIGGTYETVVFASPIPLMIVGLTRLAYFNASDGNSFLGTKLKEVLVFHNDRREKKELPGGKIIQVVASEGWELL